MPEEQAVAPPPQEAPSASPEAAPETGGGVDAGPSAEAQASHQAADDLENRTAAAGDDQTSLEDALKKFTETNYGDPVRDEEAAVRRANEILNTDTETGASEAQATDQQQDTEDYDAPYKRTDNSHLEDSSASDTTSQDTEFTAANEDKLAEEMNKALEQSGNADDPFGEPEAQTAEQPSDTNDVDSTTAETQDDQTSADAQVETTDSTQDAQSDRSEDQIVTEQESAETATTDNETVEPSDADSTAEADERTEDTGDKAEDETDDQDKNKELTPEEAEAKERQKNMEIGAELQKLGIDPTSEAGKEVFKLIAENPDGIQLVRSTVEAAKLKGVDVESTGLEAQTDKVEEKIKEAEDQGDTQRAAELTTLWQLLKAMLKIMANDFAQSFNSYDRVTKS